MSNNSWFPIAKGLIDDEDFRTLTATEKLYLWLVMSEFNIIDGEFYRADIWFAAALNLSVEKIRKARAKLAKLGFIDMTPGKQDVARKKNIATTYKNVKWLEMSEGEQFSKMDRPTFELLIGRVRSGVFTHEDVVCWVYVYHLHWCVGGKYLTMSKSEFTHATNMPKALKCVRNLLGKFKFSDSEDGLFDFFEEYRSIRFKNIRNVAFNEDRLNLQRRDIESQIKAIRDKEKRKEQEKRREAGEVFVEDLVPLFEKLYEEIYLKKPMMSGNYEKLNELGDPKVIAQAIKDFLFGPVPNGFSVHTLSCFIKRADNYINR